MLTVKVPLPPSQHFDSSFRILTSGLFFRLSLRKLHALVTNNKSSRRKNSKRNEGLPWSKIIHNVKSGDSVSGLPCPKRSSNFVHFLPLLSWHSVAQFCPVSTVIHFVINWKMLHTWRYCCNQIRPECTLCYSLIAPQLLCDIIVRMYSMRVSY